MSSDYSVWKREEAEAKEREGLTGRGIVGCISVLISAGLGYLAYWWVSNNYNLRHMFNIPKEWPSWVIDVLGVLILFIVVQATFTLITAVGWKLTGRDKKVGDKMDELLAQWDEIDY